MDQDLKRRWVKALRSGTYPQGRLALENNGRFCCLGVLCVVAKLPLEDYAPITKILGMSCETFVNMNDSEHQSFKQIADYIEINL